MERLKEKWQLFSSSEKRLIIIGSCSILIMAAYFYGYKPYQRMINDYRQQISIKTDDLNWLKSVGFEVRKLKARSNNAIGKPLDGSLIDVVDKSIKQNRLAKALKRIEASGQNKVSIQLEKIGFDQLVLWAGYLKKRN